MALACRALVAVAALLALARPASAEAPLHLVDLDLSAARIEADDRAGTLDATGDVLLEGRGVVVTATAMHYDTRLRRGTLTGPIVVTGADFSLAAEDAAFDLAAETAELRTFRGRWHSRAQFSGDTLHLGPHLIVIEQGMLTTCMHPEPDVGLTAGTFRYFPDADRLNLAGERVGVRILGQDITLLPYFTTTIDENEQQVTTALLPVFGFDAYRGFLTSTRLDFSLGENSRGSLPVNFSSARGWSAGIEHALAVGPGQAHNAVYVEAPWASGRGGVRAVNSYAWTLRNGWRGDISADYRSEINGIAVHRLPELTVGLPSMRIPGVLSMTNELRAGYLWEEATDQQATRLRWSAPFNTPIWTPVPGWQTWVDGTPFLNHYIFSPFGGVNLAWNHRQPWLPDFSTNETLELARVFGATPFAHDRVYDVERLRLGASRAWTPAFGTGANVAWSRLNQQGSFGVEDVTLSVSYRWHCFGLSLGFHPLIYGIETHFETLNF